MAVVIRLQRTGKPHQASFRLVAIEKSRGPHGTPIEVLGNYNPKASKIKEKVQVSSERVDRWIKAGARPSPTVESLLKALGKAARPQPAAAPKGP